MLPHISFITSSIGSERREPALNACEHPGGLQSERRVIRATLAKVPISASSGILTSAKGVGSASAVRLLIESRDSTRYQYLLVQKVMLRSWNSCTKPRSWYAYCDAATSVCSPSKTTVALSMGVPRFQLFTTRGYPLSVSVFPSPPKSVPTNTSLRERYWIWVLAAFGIANPPSDASTHFSVLRSNSRRVSASEPPGERAMIARSHTPSGPSSRRVEPCQTQVSAVSTAGGGRASTSITVFHSGLPLL
mmetsp:Transcript_25781/g.61158  ORF Transcript_25781/g.61158 Transcript_25781/m.61158 type:complete len:248 (-) Transcript_25781:286-1029(-)